MREGNAAVAHADGSAHRAAADGRRAGLAARQPHPAMIEADARGGAQAEQRRREQRRRKEGHDAPDEVARRCRVAEKRSVEEGKAALRATRATGQRHRGGNHLHHGTGGQALEEVGIATKGVQDEPGDHVEAGQLRHRHHKRQPHRRQVGGGALEGVGELLHLHVDDLGPVLGVLEPVAAVCKVDRRIAHAADEAGAQAHHKEADQLEQVDAEDHQVEEDDVAIALEEEAELGDKHDRREEHDAELEHDEARELRGAGLAGVEARAGQADDLAGDRARHHGREVAEEDARRLDAHQVAHADGRLRVDDHGDHIGEHAEDEIHQVAEGGRPDPARVHTGERIDEGAHLAGKDKVGDINANHADQKKRALACAGLVVVVVGAARAFADLRFWRNRFFGLLRHVPPLVRRLSRILSVYSTR